MEISNYLGPVAVTLYYFVVYYGLQVHQLRVKNRLKREYDDRGEKFDRYSGEDRFMLAADRSMLNTLEHMPVFLTLMWLTAVFVSPQRATLGGAVYAAIRTYYPFTVGSRLGRGIRARVLVATVPGYAVLVYFLVSLLIAMLS